MKALIGCLFLIWAIQAQAVSRVGGGKVRSNSSGFELTVPVPFLEITPYITEGIRASGPMAFMPGRGVTKQFVEISEFSYEFADATLLSKENLVHRFASSNWVQEKNSANCILALKSTENNLVAYILTWGDGKGFVLKGPNLMEVEVAMQRMISSLRLSQGACSWK